MLSLLSFLNIGFMIASFKQLGNALILYPKLISLHKMGANSFLASLINFILISSESVAVFSFRESIIFSTFSTVSFLKANFGVEAVGLEVLNPG